MSADPRYPIGPFKRPESCSSADRERYTQDIADLPVKLSEAVKGLTEAQLDTPYRDGGWTVRQLVHHVADSHMNSYIRFKFAMAVDHPTIMPYDENVWAAFDDASKAPVSVSLGLLTSLHARWTQFLLSFNPPDFSRTVLHPENGVMTIDTLMALYSWHCRHHTAHVTELRVRMGW